MILFGILVMPWSTHVTIMTKLSKIVSFVSLHRKNIKIKILAFYNGIEVRTFKFNDVLNWIVFQLTPLNTWGTARLSPIKSSSNGDRSCNRCNQNKRPKRESWFQAWNEVTWQLDNHSILYIWKAYYLGFCFVLISQVNIRGWSGRSGTRKPESKNSWPRVKPDPIRNARHTRFWKKLQLHLLCISKPELLPETRSTKPETRNDGFRKTRLDFRKKSTRSFSSKHVETISLK